MAEPSSPAPASGVAAEDEFAMWQDVLDAIASGRPGDMACPVCRHRPLLVEEIDFATRVRCGKCGQFIQGRFTP